MPVDSALKYLVVGKRQETPTITTLILTLEDGLIPPYVPGQCITVYFPESNAHNGKTYSISSAPFERSMMISVRAVGEFSNRLCSMRCGDAFLGSLPWGFFNAKRAETNLFMIAAGMGIAPFRSIILDAFRQKPTRQIFLLYSTRTSQEALFYEEFMDLSKKYARVHLQQHITREHNSSSRCKHGRIKSEDIIQNVENVMQTEFLICGSTSFVSDQRNSLKKAGVSEEQIHTEAHF